jgi:hypothetical protein
MKIQAKEEWVKAPIIPLAQAEIMVSIVFHANVRARK